MDGGVYGERVGVGVGLVGAFRPKHFQRETQAESPPLSAITSILRI